MTNQPTCDSDQRTLSVASGGKIDEENCDPERLWKSRRNSLESELSSSANCHPGNEHKESDFLVLGEDNFREIRTSFQANCKIGVEEDLFCQQTLISPIPRNSSVAHPRHPDGLRNDTSPFQGVKFDIQRDDSAFVNHDVDECKQCTHQESLTRVSDLRADELMKTKERLRATSQEFIEHLRGASVRRKMNISRSRDALVSKERERRETVSSKVISTVSHHVEKTAKSTTMVKHFTARPVPKYAGKDGNGGLSGVPKVEKRSLTVARSPLLGARRTSGMKECAKEKSRTVSSSSDKENFSFKARPLPRAIRLGYAGQSGVPKVEKRPTTNPESPLLGYRRAVSPSSSDSGIPTKVEFSVSQHLESSATRARRFNQPLAGLRVLHEGNSARRQSGSIITSYQGVCNNTFGLHSTVRAQKRAQFERQRIFNEDQRKREEQLKRKEQIKSLYKVLGSLRATI